MRPTAFVLSIKNVGRIRLLRGKFLNRIGGREEAAGSPGGGQTIKIISCSAACHRHKLYCGKGFTLPTLILPYDR